MLVTCIKQLILTVATLWCHSSSYNLVLWCHPPSYYYYVLLWCHPLWLLCIIVMSLTLFHSAFVLTVHNKNQRFCSFIVIPPCVANLSVQCVKYKLAWDDFRAEISHFMLHISEQTEGLDIYRTFFARLKLLHAKKWIYWPFPVHRSPILSTWLLLQ